MRKALKISLYIVGILLLLVAGAVVYLNTPSGQNFVRGRAEAYLRNKLKTEVKIGHLGYGLPKYIVLNDVLALDQARDTLLAVGELKIDINMLQLLHKEVSVQQLLLKGVHSHVYRNMPDTTFNFTYIITAFTGGKKDTAKAKDTTASSLKINLDRVKLEDIHVRYDDHTGGVLLAINLNELNLDMKQLDLDKMLFHIKDLEVSGLQSTFAMGLSYLPIHPKDTAQTKLVLMADNVGLHTVSFGYQDTVSKLAFGINLGGLQLQLNKFSLLDNLLDVKKLAISNTAMVLKMGKNNATPAPTDTVVNTDTTAGWHVKSGNVQLVNVSYKMDNDNDKPQPAGIDYAHMDMQCLALGLKDLFYTPDSIAGNVQHLAAREKSGVEINELRTVFNYNQHGANLQHLYLQTPNTTLQNHLEVHYPSIAAIQKQMQLLQVNINLENSVVGMKDVLLFAPQLASQDVFRKYKDSHVKLAATITGYLNNLNIANLYAAGLESTEVQLSGRLSGIPEANKINYNLNIASFMSSRNDVEQFVPDSLLTSVRIPDKFGIKGQVAGTVKDYNADLVMMSTDGMAYVKGSLAMSGGAGHERYNMLVKAGGLNVGRILRKDSLMGMVTATFTAKGESFNVKTMNATVNGQVASALVKGYRYHDIKLSGSVVAEKGKLDFLAVDTNLQVQLTGEANFSGKYPSAKADIKLDSIDFRALKLYSTELRARGLIHLDFPVLNPDYPQGQFTWWKPVINADGKRYYLDSMYVTSHPGKDTGQNIVANLDVVQATITGHTPLTKIWPIVQEHINRHYKYQSGDSTKKSIAAIKQEAIDTMKLPATYDLQVQAHVVDKPMLHGVLPGLTSFDSIHIDGKLSPEHVILNVAAPEIVYGSSTIENAHINVNGVDSAFTYKVLVDKVAEGDLAVYFANIHGTLDKDNITTNISLADQGRKERFALAATLQNVGDSQIIQLQPGLKLDYNTWTVAQPNRIVLADGGYYVRNFEISDSGQSIKANSDAERINAPLKIDIAGFMLSNITDVISPKDTLLADGVLNGNVTIQQTQPSLQMAGDLTVKNLVVMNDTLGDLHALVSNKQANTLAAQVTLKGQGNDIALNGNYYLQQNNGNDFDMKLDVNALAVHSFETLAQNQIRNSSGYLRGNLAVKGTASAPVITGELHTDNLVTTVSQLNSKFTMPAEKITFTSDGLTFNNFTVLDSNKNKAVFGGTINTTNLKDIEMNMTVRAKNWQALHSTAKDNKTFYGNVLVTANLDIKGAATAPSIEGNLKILKGTNATYVNPETEPELQNTKGIVKFINMKDTGRGNYLVPDAKKKRTHRKMKVGSEFNVNITVDKAAQFSMIIDQSSGDFLSVKGDATLNASMSAGGTIGLTGTYELHGGSYQLNYNFIKRKFLIKDGSIITFAGDPVTGTNLDVTAIYEAQVAPYDLVEREVADPTELNYYKQQLPFQVDLHMKGQIMKPNLTFDVELPENKVYPLSAEQIETIQGKLNQVRTDTSELNKQVFAVLVLGRFVSDDPFSSGASTSATFTAIQSVSTFIGEQLNQAAGKFIKGVDFSVDLASTEDYTSGNMQQRTDLNLAASKQLLNNRLKLTIGNDFELQGPQTASDQSSLVPTNLAADYQLTEDGRYSMRAYRKVYDEGVLEGFVTETGLDFIVNLNYNYFKDVFKKKEKKESSGKSKSNSK